jgi:hypothetical protein
MVGRTIREKGFTGRDSELRLSGTMGIKRSFHSAPFRPYSETIFRHFAHAFRLRSLMPQVSAPISSPARCASPNIPDPSTFILSIVTLL